MTERVLVAVAWPYANGPLHLGHIAGAYLPADIFKRYHRAVGNEVLMISGSDQHGTPITITAEQEGKQPGEIAERYHSQFLESWQALGISFDLFTTTGTANHAQVVQDVFLTLLDKGCIYRNTVFQPLCPQCQRFLPDRYVEGTCPYCGFSKARGDQCDGCGRPLNPADMADARCRLCGTRSRFEESEHFFFRLTEFRYKLLEWLKPKTFWRQDVLNFTTRYLEEGLKDRAITRDIGWGVPVPVAGFENKRIYVWFEAVIGYLSATKEWAVSGGDSERWRSFWQDEGTRSYYFIGKDNIPFHTIIWPAMLMGYGGLNLPYDVPANEFLTIEGKKLSTSRNWAVWLPDYLSRYDPDPLRYLLSINMPETGDSDFSWREFFRRNNDELVATYGNLVNRVLTLVYRNFDRSVPPPGELDDGSRDIMKAAELAVGQVGELIGACRFKAAITAAMALAQAANRYLDYRSPWKVIKEDKPAAAGPLYVAMYVISCLKTVLYPFLPFSSQKLHRLLSFEGDVEGCGWKLQRPEPGQKLPEPEPLFSKLEERLVEEESSRLG
ncbi:methionine--tRNA ligase [Chloroflexota bacterium]